MAESKSGSGLSDEVESATETKGPVGEATAAKSNRQRETRLRIIEGYSRVGLSYDQWPDFVRAYYADPGQRTQYHHAAFPIPFQASAFDRLNQSAEDWAKVADQEWERHRNKFLEQCEYWVKAGVDEEVEKVRALRAPGSRKPSEVGSQKRGTNAPIERRYEWAARYLGGVPLKEIAGENADPSTVGRIVRKIVRDAGWNTKSRLNKPVAQAPSTHQEFPKYKYHRTETERIVQNREEELALGDGWENTPPAR
jgi:hypothetical protein